MFAHNMWREFGHKERVRVQRTITALARAHGKAVWYDNYTSKWENSLMRRYLGDPPRTDRVPPRKNLKPRDVRRYPRRLQGE
jgi:hypothetical protein